MILPESFDLSACTNTETNFCQLTTRPLLPLARINNVCPISLFLNDTPSVRNTCKINVQYFPHSADSRYIESGIWALSSAVTFDLTVTCNKVSRQVRINPPITYITLDSGCYGTSAILDLPPFYQQTSTYNLKDLLVPPSASLSELDIRMTKDLGSVDLTQLITVEELTELGPQDFHGLQAKLKQSSKPHHGIGRFWKIVIMTIGSVLGFIIIILILYFCLRFRAPHKIQQRIGTLLDMFRSRFRHDPIEPEMVYQIECSRDATPRVYRLASSQIKDSYETGGVARAAPSQSHSITTS